MVRSSWPSRAQFGEQPYSRNRADDAAREQHQPQREIEGAAAPIRMAPENDDAAMWLDTVATATAGEMPMKIKSGVIRKPPPMPNMPEMNPTASPIAEHAGTR